MNRRTLASVGLVLVLFGAACSGSDEDAGSSTSTAAKAEKAADKADASFDSGDAVAIRGTGFEPRWLVVPLGETVTFTNDTAADQQIVFDNARDASGAFIQSPVIPPEGTWQWKVDSFASFAYHAPGLPGVDGRVQVLPPAEP